MATEDRRNAAALSELVAIADGEYRDTPVHEALQTVSGPLGLDEQDLQKLRDRVLRVRVSSERRRWREMQLQSLVDTAQHLLSTSAIDELLGEVVAAARRLVPCDVAHINLGSQDDQLLERSRSLRGETSPAWRHHGPTLDRGLTGRVFETNQPVTTMNYLSDASILHTPSGDEAIREDGIESLAGVPIRRGDEVVGALIASWRSPRPTSAEELSLLGSLASLVGAGLEGARLEWQRRAAVDEVQAVNERFRVVNETLEWSAALHDRLMQLCLEGADLEAVVRELSRSFDCAVAIQDELGSFSATTHPEFAPSGSYDDLETSGFAEHEGRQIFACRATSAETRLATLLLDRSSLNDTERRAIERAAVICALLVANQRALADVRLRDESGVVRELVYGRYRPAGSGARDERFAVVEGGCLVVAVDLTEQHHRTRAAARDAGARLGAVIGEMGDYIAVLVPPGQEEAIPRTFERAFARAGVEPFAGVDGPTTSFADIPGAYQQAVACARAARALGNRRKVVSSAELGFVGLLLAGDRAAGVDTFLEHTIGPVLAYDERKGSDLIATLDAYVGGGSSLQAAATAVHVHPNTAYQRIQRVTKLLGPDWREPDRFVQVQLALHLQRVRGGSP